MRIIAPRNQAFDRIIRSIPYSVVREERDRVVYEGIFGFKIDITHLGMRARDFRRFVDEIRVEGGRKRRLGNIIIVVPVRRRELAVRLSDDEYDALRKMAEAEGRDCEDLFRELALEAVAKRRGM